MPLKTREQTTIGDPIEIRVVFMPHGGELQDKWLPATVCHKTPFEIGAALANGERIAIPLHKTADWRVPVITEVDTKWGVFTLDHMRELKRSYEEAVESGIAEFEALGHTWLVSFTKYLLEYAASEGMEL